MISKGRIESKVYESERIDLATANVRLDHTGKWLSFDTRITTENAARYEIPGLPAIDDDEIRSASWSAQPSSPTTTSSPAASSSIRSEAKRPVPPAPSWLAVYGSTRFPAARR
jgi:hypothetical protein